MTTKPLIIAVVGPTASGKSELAVELAKKFNGEIISADSRQVYRGMNIGSGKVEGRWHDKTYRYNSIPHYGIDIASPLTQYSVARFQKYAKKVIQDILKRGKTPIICGGTGQWIDAVIFNQQMPAVKPDVALRKKLDQLSTQELFKQLKKLDPVRAANIDAKNPRRLIRALEIVLSTGRPVPPQTQSSPYRVLWIGIHTDQTKLLSKIKRRLQQRLKAGMINEVKLLHNNGVSWKRLEDFGLEYKFCALFLQNKLSQAELVDQLTTAIKQYAKRQLTWFKRNHNIHWINVRTKAIQLVKAEIKNSR